jgi:hypothetical protein
LHLRFSYATEWLSVLHFSFERPRAKLSSIDDRVLPLSTIIGTSQVHTLSNDGARSIFESSYIDQAFVWQPERFAGQLYLHQEISIRLAPCGTSGMSDVSGARNGLLSDTARNYNPFTHRSEIYFPIQISRLITMLSSTLILQNHQFS